MKILNLTLKKEWFDKIAKGQKTEEYREQKDYWTNRLVDEDGICKTFDEVHFRNGYGKDAPFMRFKCGVIYPGIKRLNGKTQMVYVIELKEVLELKNWNRDKR